MPKIINFHDIYDQQWFQDTIDVIQDMYDVVPFSEIEHFYQGKKTNKKTVHLTVDDGHISTYTIIFPILKKLGLTASIFVSPKIIKEQSNFWYFESSDYEKDKLRRCIAEVLKISSEKISDLYPRSIMKLLTLEQNWEIIQLYQEKYNIPTKKGQYINTEQLQELEKSGVFTIGAHTMNHPILANENDETAKWEIQQSVLELSELLGRKVNSFAYPNGSFGLDFSSREMSFLKEINIDYAFSFEFKTLNINDNLLSIPRYGLSHGNKDFIRKKLKYAATWEPIKKVIFNNEDKYRLKIKNKLALTSSKMTDLIIKSFNRPYYLDRCLLSIHKHVRGHYRIIVLDDGTPKKYLEKIKQKFPNIEILLSEQYPEKIKSIQDNIETGKEINGFKIPTDLWYNAVKSASNYVLVTEDDVWFTHDINLDELTKDMNTHHISLVKLGWLGNNNDDTSLEITPITKHIERIIPRKLFTANPFIMDCFMYNRYKFFTILYKLGLVDHYSKRKYWTLNSIAMGLYQKDYWLHIWKDAKGQADEKQQLRNAAGWYHRLKSNPNLIARTQQEVMKTTFQSSATNSYHQYELNFDVNYFNHIINEAWYNEQFDPMQNFPKDISLDYYDKFLNENISKTEFHNWVGKFKTQYQNQGAKVD